MTSKEKIVGLLLLIVGAYPFLLKISSINAVLGKYAWTLPGQWLYQTVLIVLGLFLFIEKKKTAAIPQR
jgi:cadmium resistance protein CadD (predicted permease)